MASGLRMKTRKRGLDRVGRGGGGAALACPIRVEELSTRLVNALVGVGTKVVALGLEQVRRQNRRAVTVKERKRCAERGNRDSTLGCDRHHIAPGFL